MALEQIVNALLKDGWYMKSWATDRHWWFLLGHPENEKIIRIDLKGSDGSILTVFSNETQYKYELASGRHLASASVSSLELDNGKILFPKTVYEEFL